jgi:hypothetical protein
MARVFIDGFETGMRSLWNMASDGVANVTNAPNSPSPRTLYVPRSNRILKGLPESSEYYFGFKLYQGDWSYMTSAIITFMNGPTVLGLLNRDSDGTGKLRAYKGDFDTLLATSDEALPKEEWNRVEVRFIPHTTAGVFQVKINDVLWIDFAGSTSPVDSPINLIQLGRATANGSDWWFDDFVVDDAEWPGQSQIRTVYPIGQYMAEMVPSVGSNFQCVDDIPISVADYVVATELDQTDLYEMSDFPDEDFITKAVQAEATCLKNGVPDPTALQFFIRAGITDFFSDDKLIPLAQHTVTHLWTISPLTGVRFAEAEISGMRLGVKAVA